MFRLANRDKKITNLPYFPALPESKPRTGTLPQEKYSALLAVLPPYVRPVLTIAYRTGMRLGEILGLTWSNIDWMGSVVRLEDTKNGEPREIPFTGELETVLRQQFQKRQERCDRVCFRVARCGHAVPIRDFRHAWHRACRDVDLPALLFHDLRRTFISDAEHAGAPRGEIMKCTGHLTESVYKRYAIENRERRRQALAQLDTYRAEKFGDNSGTECTKIVQPGPAVN